MSYTGRTPEAVSSGVRAGRATVQALVVYTAFVVYQSLANGGGWRCSGEVLARTARLSRSDILANVAAYVPLGLLCVLAATQAARGPSASPSFRRVIAVGLGSVAATGLLSLGLELAQACQVERVSSVFDLVANIAGGALGAAVGLLLQGVPAGIDGSASARGPARAVTAEGRLRLLTVAVAALWALSQASPWAFAVDLGTIRSHLAFLRHWSDGPPLDAWNVARHAGAWVAAGCACRLAARNARVAVAGLIAAVSASVLLQILLDVTNPLSFEELAGLSAGVIGVLPGMMLARAEPSPRRWAAGLVLGAVMTVAAYQLRPGTGPVHAFSWWPRVGLGGMRGALDYTLLFGWFGLAASVAARWAARSRTGWVRLALPASAVLLTLLSEAAQVRIPGRGPDVSAPLFTLLAVLLTAAVLAEGHRPVD